MKSLPVNWYQGLFVRPHHFQAHDAYWTEFHHTSQRWDHPYGYGLRRIDEWNEISEALRGDRFRVASLEARTPDGSLITAQQLELVLPQALQEDSFDIHVAIPYVKEGAHNVGLPGDNSAVRRYDRWDVPWRDEANFGGEAQIECRRLRVELLPSTRDEKPAGYESLRIARMKRIGNQATLDEEYIPPLLNIHAWPPMANGVVRALRDLIRERIVESAERLRHVEIGGRNAPADSFRVMMLDRLNEAYTVLDLLDTASDVHPFCAYVELGRILGRLSLFSQRRMPIPVQPYDHERLGPVFFDLREKIKLHLRPVTDRFMELPFLGDGQGMSIPDHELTEKWFDRSWDWYIGVDPGGLNHTALRDWLEKDDNWCVASRSELPQKVRNRAMGLGCTFCESSIPDLYDYGNWVFYRVSQGENDPTWRRVASDHTLSMNFRLVRVTERSSYLDATISGNHARLSFSLFAVRR
jgi:type VI secretion system protein ImpJ